MMRINPDINARRSDYKHLPSNEVLVTKIFYTVQGEGPCVGEPAVFVRLAGCNLGSKEMCPWCDTYFALEAGEVIRVAKLLEQADALVPLGVRKLMVLTGGEPMLQNPFVLVDYFLNHDWRVQIETNGYFWSEEMHEVACRHRERLIVVVSPKVNARQVYPPLDPRLVQDSSCLKFVVDDDPLSPYFQPPEYAHSYFEAGRPVYVSPINHYAAPPDLKNPASFWDTDPAILAHASCRRNHRYATSLAMKYGWRVSLQTHLFMEAE